MIEGEKLDLLFASRPLEDDENLKKEEKDRVKAYVLQLLKETYGITEEDFVSAELEIVPAGKARDCGIDRSMIMAYGQDDRVCAFTSLFALLDVRQVKKTACCILVDKEEIGSVGAVSYTHLDVYKRQGARRAFHRFTVAAVLVVLARLDVFAGRSRHSRGIGAVRRVDDLAALASFGAAHIAGNLWYSRRIAAVLVVLACFDVLAGRAFHSFRIPALRGVALMIGAGRFRRVGHAGQRKCANQHTQAQPQRQ